MYKNLIIENKKLKERNSFLEIYYINNNNKNIIKIEEKDINNIINGDINEIINTSCDLIIEELIKNDDIKTVELVKNELKENIITEKEEEEEEVTKHILNKTSSYKCFHCGFKKTCLKCQKK